MSFESGVAHAQLAERVSGLYATLGSVEARLASLELAYGSLGLGALRESLDALEARVSATASAAAEAVADVAELAEVVEDAIEESELEVDAEVESVAPVSDTPIAETPPLRQHFLHRRLGE